MFTYLKIYILISVYIFLHPYTCGRLHISTPIYQRVFTYFYHHIPAHLYILLHTYTWACYISLHLYTCACLHYIRNPMQAYLCIFVLYTYACLHTYIHTYLCKFIYFRTLRKVYLQVYIFQ